MDEKGKTASAGYSGRTMAQKLGVKPGATVVLHNAPAGWEIPGLPERVQLGDSLDAFFDLAIWFVRATAELTSKIEQVASQVPAASSLWIAWPRRAAGHASDVTEQILRDFVLPTGLVDVKVAALDADWSGLKFMWRRTRRGALPR
jgi:hypothetical protein